MKTTPAKAVGNQPPSTMIPMPRLRVFILLVLGLLLAQGVAQARDKIENLRPIGQNRPVRVDPHLYKASAGDVRRLAQADVVFYGGLDLEGKMVELLERNPKAIPVTLRIPQERLLKPAATLPSRMRVDPHVWFDVGLWKLTVNVVRDALSRLDPAGAKSYANQAARYLQRLDQLEAFVERELSRIPPAQRVLITAHDAFGYFGRRYKVEVRGLQGVSTVAEAGTKDIQDLADFIVRRRIPAIFVETSVPQRTIEAVAAAVKARGFSVEVGGSLFSDSAGRPGTPQSTYVGMVEHNVRTIVAGLLGGDTP